MCDVSGLWVCESPDSSDDNYMEVRVESRLHMRLTSYYF